MLVLFLNVKEYFWILMKWLYELRRNFVYNVRMILKIFWFWVLFEMIDVYLKLISVD